MVTQLFGIHVFVEKMVKKQIVPLKLDINVKLPMLLNKLNVNQMCFLFGYYNMQKLARFHPTNFSHMYIIPYFEYSLEYKACCSVFLEILLTLIHLI